MGGGGIMNEKETIGENQINLAIKLIGSHSTSDFILM